MSEPSLRENVSLADYTTFKVGGPARYFTEVKSIEEIKGAVAWAIGKNLSIFVLADGSNVIVSQNGFPGLVIKVSINGLKIEGDRLTAGAATSMATLVDKSIEADLAGLEWAGGLPGSFGGTIRGNAGAFGGEIKDTIEEVVSISLKNEELTRHNNQDCQFEYRGSIFKKLGNEAIISATLRLKPGDKVELRRIADEHIEYRRQRHPIELPNSGSIFKNTPIDKVPANHLGKWQEVIKNDPFPVVPTAKIISDAGLVGTVVGGAQVSTKHTNYIVNIGNATGEDIVALIEKIKETIREKYGVELEVEPELLGFNT